MKKIYIDFDETLYDTDSFYKDFLNLCESYFIDNEKVDKVRREIFSKNGDFNLDLLAQTIMDKYNLEEQFLSKVEELYSPKYLFADAILFLENIYLNRELVLLTYGNNDYQFKKIQKANIIKYFQDIIITNESKANLSINYCDSIFIDNNPDELLGYYNRGAKNLIRIKKDSDKFAKISTNIDNVVDFSDFNDIIKSKTLDRMSEDE